MNLPSAQRLSASIASFGAHCLELHGVVCMACRQACAARALRFVPLACGMAAPHIDLGRCDGCGRCAESCPAGTIHLVQRPVL